MKKLFIPTPSELYKMQDMGVTVDNYLACKAAEKLILKRSNGRHILADFGVVFEEDADVSKAVCTVYPEELPFFQRKYVDIDPYSLVGTILERNPSTKISRLDALRHINIVNDRELDYSANQLMKQVISILASELPKSPQYRFEYMESNPWLDLIFSGKLFDWMIQNDKSWELSKGDYTKLYQIEPYYALNSSNAGLYWGMEAYTRRYGINSHSNSECNGKFDLDNPNPKTRKLLRILEIDSNNGQ